MPAVCRFIVLKNVYLFDLIFICLELLSFTMKPVFNL